MFGRLTKSVLGLAFLAVLLAPLAVRGPAEAAKRTAMDFLVQKVSIGPGCRVEVVVVRKGPGKLPRNKVGNLPLLRIKVGRRHRDFAFKVVDPGGVLAKGQGVITFRSPVVVRSDKLPVSAIVDPDNLIRESVERRNNIKHVKVFPENCTGGLGGRAVVRSFKIADVYLQNGTLRLVIAKKRAVKVSKAELKQILLQVQGAGGIKRWPLAKAYKLGKRGPKGNLHFNTNLRAKPGSRVAVSLRLKKYTKRRVFTLATDTAIAGRSGLRAARADSSVRTLATRAPDRLRPRRPGRMVPRREDNGVLIEEPRNWYSVSPNSDFRVRYVLSLSTDRITIELWRGSSTVVDTLYDGPPHADGVAMVHIGDVPTGSYKIHIKYPPRYGPRNGTSDPFRVAYITASRGEGCHGCVKVTSPASGSIWPRGTTRRVKWTTTPNDGRAPSGWRVYLIRAGGPPETIYTSRPQYDRDAHEYYFDYRVPSDHRTGETFQVRVVGLSNPWGSWALAGNSGRFTIPSRSIAFTGEFNDSGRTFYYSNEYRIRWRVDGEVSVPLKIELFKGDRLVKELAASVPASAGRFTWQILTLPTFGPLGGEGFLVGDDFRIRLTTLQDTPIVTDSPEFSLRSPDITVTSPASRDVFHFGDPMQVRWVAPNLAGRVSVIMADSNGREAVLYPTVAATSGGIDWTVGHVHLVGGSTSASGGDIFGLNLKIKVQSLAIPKSAESSGYLRIHGD